MVSIGDKIKFRKMHKINLGTKWMSRQRRNSGSLATD